MCANIYDYDMPFIMVLGNCMRACLNVHYVRNILFQCFTSETIDKRRETELSKMREKDVSSAKVQMII